MVLLEFHLFEWIAFVSSLLYTILAAHRSIWCWGFGAIGSFFTLILCLQASLFSESILHVFYILAAVYGWYAWHSDSNHGDKSKVFTIQNMSGLLHFLIIAIGIILTLLLGRFWVQFGAALPYIDAFTTSFSFIATWLIAKRYLQNWLYWIIIDAVSVGVYYSRDMKLLSVLFFIYTFLAVYGYFKWKGMNDKSA